MIIKYFSFRQHCSSCNIDSSSFASNNITSKINLYNVGITPLYQFKQKTITKNRNRKDSVWCEHHWLAVSTIFLRFFMEKNFKRVFLKATFFMLCWAFLWNYWTDPYEILYTYSAHVSIFDFWFLIQHKILIFTTFINRKGTQKTSFFGNNFWQPPFCYFCMKINNSRSDSSHTHAEPKSFRILCFRWFISEQTQQPCLFWRS